MQENIFIIVSFLIALYCLNITPVILDIQCPFSLNFGHSVSITTNQHILTLTYYTFIFLLLFCVKLVIYNKEILYGHHFDVVSRCFSYKKRLPSRWIKIHLPSTLAKVCSFYIIAYHILILSIL